MTTLRVAMILRGDADRVFGGDSLAMHKLAEGMRPCGVDVVVRRLPDLPPAREFDLVHMMSFAPTEHVAAMHAWAGSARLAVLCSPLYYNDFRDWYERAIVSVPRWQKLARLLGKSRAWFVYRTLQASRLPFQATWQTIRATLLAADVIATTSRWENRTLADHFRLPEDVRKRMRTSPLGIDAGLYGQTHTAAELDAFRVRYGLPPGYVVEVARIEEKKNQLAVIEALYDEPVPLVFVGKPSPYFAPDYADRCHRLGERRGRTHFLGWLPDADLPLLYAAAAAHILPSWSELPGLASLEAGASGTRVISTRVSGLTEMVGQEGWYCDPYDRASIRHAVAAALSSPVPAGLRQRLLREYSWPNVAAATKRLYEDVLASRQ
jgi:glycosyltransferase involved in cell wall biosynthesis